MRKLLVVLGLLFMMASSAQAHIFGALVANKVVLHQPDQDRILLAEVAVENDEVVVKTPREPAVVPQPSVVPDTTIYATVAPTWDCLLGGDRVFNPASGYFESQCFEVESTGSIARFFETSYWLGDQNQFVLYVEDCDLRQTDLLVIKIDVVTTTTHNGDCGSCEFVMSM